VIRSKGNFWLATRPEYCGNWSQAGAISRNELAGFWWAATPKVYWPEEADQLVAIAARWQEPFGDRQQEIVLIGMNMGKAALIEAFEGCLLTDDEMLIANENNSSVDYNMAAWQVLPDPFPVWDQHEQSVGQTADEIEAEMA
jgi:hypothetical protein